MASTFFSGRHLSIGQIEENIRCYMRKKNEKAAFLVEEFLVQEGFASSDPVIPLDYKFHCFGGRALLVHVDDRNVLSRDVLRRRQGWFSRDWCPSPHRMRIREKEYYGFQKPQCYDSMLEIVETIARECCEYIRVDMYATDKGPVVGEISSYTHAGLGFTDFGCTIFEGLLELHDQR